MKLTKSDLKSLIKECLKEELSVNEGIFGNKKDKLADKLEKKLAADSAFKAAAALKQKAMKTRTSRNVLVGINKKLMHIAMPIAIEFVKANDAKNAFDTNDLQNIITGAINKIYPLSESCNCKEDCHCEDMEEAFDENADEEIANIIVSLLGRYNPLFAAEIRNEAPELDIYSDNDIIRAMRDWKYNVCVENVTNRSGQEDSFAICNCNNDSGFSFGD